MAGPSIPLIINRLLGRNNVDPPQSLPSDLATEALNMDYFAGSLGQKRNGSANVTVNGFSVAGRVDHLFRYLPSDDETAAELHAVDSGALTTMQRLAGGTNWATYTLANAIQANSVDVSMVNFNGKLFQAYNTSVNRLHVYPSVGGTHRRVGLALPAAPTTALAAGAVTDTRKYAICWTEQSGGTTIRRSNLGTKTAAVVLAAQKCTNTRPTAPSDGETHWELYAFSTADTYTIGYLIATTAIATTTADDNNATLSGNAPPTSGANTPPPSSKFLLTDGTHLIGLGAWETSDDGTGFTPSVRLVWWTPALGTNATDGDDERLSNTSTIKTYLYVDQGITGGGGPIQGNTFVFSYRSTYKLVPTGLAAQAYDRITVRTDIGCIRHQTVVMGEDEQGRPALYWLSHIGPYRAGSEGLQYIGRDIEDRWAAVNLEATSVVGWGLFHPTKHQVWWYISTGSNNDPNERIVFDCRLGRIIEIENMQMVHYGWTRQTGRGTEARHGCLFSNTLGASMSRDLLPYVGRTGTGITAPTIWKEDTGTDDAGTNFSATTTTKAYQLDPTRNAAMVEDAWLTAKTATGVTITVNVIRDFAAETVSSPTALLTASGSETRLQAKLEGASFAEGGYVQFQIGDASAASNAWVLDQFATKLLLEGGK